MLVSSTEHGWKIIYQRAHGLLAAQLAWHWKQSEHTPYWPHTLVAIAEHDDGLAESSIAENLTEAGAPKHFQLMEYSEEQYRNVMEIAASKSRWNALLTSMHLTFLYASKRSESKTLARFMDEQAVFQKQLRKELAVSGAVAESSYRLVEWCDALSLLLCMDKVQPEQRRMEISRGPDGTIHQLWQDARGKLRVEPWPFEVTEFAVQVEYRQANQLSFASAQEFAEVMKKAKVEVESWTFCQ